MKKALMTFKELEKKVGKQNPEDWKQHTNGGGWVHKSAVVAPTALVDERAIVYGTVADNAQVFDKAQIFGEARIFGDAQIAGDAHVFGDAKVSGDLWQNSPLFIVGSKGSLTNAKRGYIQSDYLCETYSWWTEHIDEYATRHGLTMQETAEYKAYIKLFTEIGVPARIKSSKT